MKRTKYTQIKVVDHSDPMKFQEQFNAAQIELKSMSPETLRIEITEKGIMAIIQYIVETQEPENARDELELMGIDFMCKHCPKFEPVLNNDGSIRKSSKRGKCMLKEACWGESSVLDCEWFCRKYLRGEIDIVGGKL